jgi:hypothetical protein
MRRSIIGWALILGFFSPSLFAGDARVTVRKAGGEKFQKWAAEVTEGAAQKTVTRIGIFDTQAEAIAASKKWSQQHPNSRGVTREVQLGQDANDAAAGIPAKDAKSAFTKRKQELKDIVDRVTKLTGHVVNIDWGDGEPPPSLSAPIVADPVAGHTVVKLAPDDVRKTKKPVADQGDIRRPQQPGPDDIRKAAIKLIAEYNSKRDAYAMEKPSGDYFASLPRLEVDPVELKTNTVAAGGKGIGIGQIGRGGKYAVWVYKSEGGQWVKQPERTFNTDDVQAAMDYADRVNAVQGWTVTTNVPKDLYLRHKQPGRMKSGQLSLRTKSGDKESPDPNTGASSGRRVARP